MYTVPTHFHPSFAPVADPDAVVRAQQARFTILTPQLIRMEYDPAGAFEDRPSQAIWYRQQPVPAFSTAWDEDFLVIETSALRLRYNQAAGAFSPTSLQVEVKSLGAVYHFGAESTANLGGTYRTLDTIDGNVPLEPGLISRAGWAVYDDSRSLVFNSRGWIAPRDDPEAALDLYFFGYGHDYLRAIQDLQKVTGQTPLLPRWALGNWWSRYFEYSEQSLKALILAFRQHRVPLSVCIIDMDWHITQTGNASSGWTGYTWNRVLFPDPQGLIDWLHQMGLKTALNLHPALGVWPHEQAYPAMCAALGVEPSQDPVQFDISDPTFTQAYFDLLHHPYEQMGVDFWWIDWQQGTQTRLPGLDPLFWLNHLHFYDLGRDGSKRPFIFSRWGGLGNHRYPIGFSGDTVITWDSLAFQPYFTATASNVGYGWWSHDIGGHMFGMEDGELFARWIQFGVFSPILRMHATKDAYIDHCPWAFDPGVFEITRSALRFRHALIPYLYSMSYRNEKDGIPPVLPLYYQHPTEEAAYNCPQEYLFGSELLAAPVTAPADPDLRLGKQAVWLPEGDWFDFFNGDRYTGGEWQALYVKVEHTPVFARAGAIVPLAHGAAVEGVANPAELEVWIFPGADRRFELFEDDGESSAYRQGQYRLTSFSQDWQRQSLTFTIHPTQGAIDVAPDPRTYILTFKGIIAPASVTVQQDGETLNVAYAYDPAAHTLRLDGIELPATATLIVALSTSAETLMATPLSVEEKVRRLLGSFRAPTFVKSRIDAALPQLLEDVSTIRRFNLALTRSQVQALVETIAGVGVLHQACSSSTERILMWNNHRDARFRWSLSTLEETWRAEDSYQTGPVPAFKVYLPGLQAQPTEDFRKNRIHHQLSVDFFGLFEYSFETP